MCVCVFVYVFVCVCLLCCLLLCSRGCRAHCPRHTSCRDRSSLSSSLPATTLPLTRANVPHHADLRRSGAYRRFPELILEHPNPAENAFRQLLLSGIAVRDPDEWEENPMDSLKSMESGVRSGGGGERVLDGLGGEGCRLAEVDGSAVAIVEVAIFVLFCFVLLFILICIVAVRRNVSARIPSPA